jgi:hypothetical protein
VVVIASHATQGQSASIATQATIQTLRTVYPAPFRIATRATIPCAFIASQATI